VCERERERDIERDRDIERGREGVSFILIKEREKWGKKERRKKRV